MVLSETILLRIPSCSDMILLRTLSYSTCLGSSLRIFSIKTSVIGSSLRSSVIETHVPILPFWTGASRLEKKDPVLSVLPEISRFEMTLAWLSGTYEFSNSITLFTNSMRKYWLLINKLGACVALVHHPSICLSTIFIISFRSVSTKALIALALAKTTGGPS